MRIPLFALPNMVVLPGIVVPFHIFEERYLQMMERILKEEVPWLAFSRLKIENDMDYYLNPEFEEWGCVLEVVHHKMREDGTYDILALGVLRAKLKETSSSDKRMYRVVDISPSPLDNLSSDKETWLKNHEEQIVQMMKQPERKKLVCDVFKKWRENQMTSRALLHIFVYSLIQNADLLQDLLMDEHGDLAIAYFSDWLRGAKDEIP